MVRKKHDVGSVVGRQQSHQADPTKQTEVSKYSRLIPVTQWADHHPWPPIGGLRYLIFNEHTNGFAHCVIRIGRRVFIDEDRFFEWIDTHRPPLPVLKSQSNKNNSLNR